MDQINYLKSQVENLLKAYVVASNTNDELIKRIKELEIENFQKDMLIKHLEDKRAVAS